MTQDLAAKIGTALDKLEAALDAATGSAGISLDHDEKLHARVEAYREVVRRQRILARDIQKAVARHDLREVSRIGTVIKQASVLMKMDLQHILSSIRLLKERDLRSAA